MNNYIGCKLIKAEPCYNDFYDADGYKVVYADGYTSWSPKEVFEKAYMEVDPNLNLKTDISVSQRMVDEFIDNKEVMTLGEKTTLVRVTLKNGFEIIETSACVDPANYSEELGAEICLKNIKNKIWAYLGFLLQTAVTGVQGGNK